ncbi:MAG: aminotransferase class I/II-fold pyridoxal phosphate-dependent enzyme [Bacteroidales bacterium]|nr:aminotransferase class I/II-fold pyridoxal phosphate-dependent enzyme [Bacteroidales bacterium]
MRDIELKYKSKLSEYLHASSDDVFLYWKGRVALYAILRAMGVGEGDEVIVPAFTCVVVPNAIKYLKAKPVYVDIDPKTYNVAVSQIESKISDKTKVLICQNTFGLSSNIEQLLEIAQRHHLYTIEDCTHGFGGTYHGKPNGSYCDAAFYSTQWNKPFSTGLGGFALVANRDLHKKIEQVNVSLEKTTLKDSISLSLLYFVREKILTDRRYWRMVKMYRWLSKYKFVQGSSSGVEIESTEMPSHYFKALSQTQMKKGLSNVEKIDTLLDLRKRNARIYNEYLESKGKTIVSPELFADHSFLKYPLLVRNREDVLRMAEENCVPLGEWFCSPIHPVMEHWDLWDFNGEDYPQAVKYAALLVNLPTDVAQTDSVLRFLDKILDWVE